VEELASTLKIDSTELLDALWFLHHHIGTLLYYPELETLKGTVICDMQILFDSASNLIRNVFSFDSVGRAVSERFRERAQFSLKDVKHAMSSHTDDLIPLDKLVELLQYLNILTPIPGAQSEESGCTQETTYFMPCVLKCARASELGVPQSPSDPPPLMLRYNCGYMPVGVFPALITNLVSQQHQSWKMIEKGLYKNRVQFRIRKDYDTVTLVSHPCYYEIVISRQTGHLESTETLCASIRSIIESTLDTVTSHMNYEFKMGYKFAFECPTHPGRQHLCVLEIETSSFMECLLDPNDRQPVPLQPEHRVWFPLKGAASSDRASSCTPLSGMCCSVSSLSWFMSVSILTGLNFEGYRSSLPPAARPHLEYELDWGHEGVEKDLYSIADVMLKWEEKLAVALTLTDVDISDIKAIHRDEPVLQRLVLVAVFVLTY